MSVLIVEDDPVNSKIVEINLQKHGYQTVVAPTAKNAMEYLESMPEIQLVICDIMMPEMDGLQFLGKMKERSEWKNIPVIMCTGLADAETVQKAGEAGCRHYVLKPIDPGLLLGKVREALRHEKPVLRDKREVMSALGFDNKAYKEVCRVFAAVVGDRIAQLEKGLEERTAQAIPIELSDVLKDATLLGAERVRTVLETLSTKNEEAQAEAENSQYPLLLRELKLLQRALPTLEPAAAAEATSEGGVEENTRPKMP